MSGSERPKFPIPSLRLAKRTQENVPAQAKEKPPARTKPGQALPALALIHGLAVPAAAMVPLKLRMQYRYGHRCMNLTYDWYYHDIPRTAEAISRQLVRSGHREIDVVTHSMGGVVLRWAYNHFPMPKLRRVVMIAPPNQGSWTANYLSEKTGPLFRLVFGEAGMQLRPGEKGLASRAGILNGVEVGIIAGGAGNRRGKRNILGIPGDCDGTVAVEETILPGMKDFVLLNYNHSHIVISHEAALMAHHFLLHGIFRPKAETGARPTPQVLPTPSAVHKELEAASDEKAAG